MVVTDAQLRVLQINPAFTRLTGFESDDVRGRVCPLLVTPPGADGADTGLGQALAAGQGFQGELLSARKNGERFWNALSLSPVHDAAGRLSHFVALLRDVSPQKEREAWLSFHARHDPLTGLPNRVALSEHLPGALARGQRRGECVAVGVIDLDDFKPVNDRGGHASGDVLLRELAARLRGCMRVGDFVARIGGDEFAVVMEVLGAEQGIEERLAAAMQRLRGAVDAPFDLPGEEPVRVGLSIGVTLSPRHGDDPSQLLRKADAALYVAKRHKSRRERCWTLWDESLLDVPPPLHVPEPEAYGPQAGIWLSQVAAQGRDLLDRFVEQFYADVHQRPSPSAILDRLSAEEFARLRRQQVEHLRQLLDPQLGADEHRARAERVGRVHALVGVDAIEMVWAMQDYTTLVERMAQALHWRRASRNALLRVVGERLKAEMRWELEGMGRVEQARHDALLHLEASTPAWRRAGRWTTEALGALVERVDGVCGAAFARPDSDHRFAIEVVAGCAGALLAAAAGDGAGLSFDADDAVLEATGARRAWAGCRIATQPRFADGEALADAAVAHGVRSCVAVPVLADSGRPFGVLLMFGAYPGQFEPWGAQLWLRSLQQIVQRGAAPGLGRAVVDTAERERFRALLFGGGLRMDMQPLIDLGTGQVSKVEALARLHGAEGSVIVPGQFLGAFDTHDLARLFREGLAQSLDWLRRWDEAGVRLDLSLNLPPDVLVLPECARWVEHALSTTGVAARRLELELLETEESGHRLQRDAAVAELAALGVRLVMDDLGSGFSSLDRLHSLPFHAVKIDQALVRRAAAQPERTIGFVGSLVALARGLGLRVGIEGLESPELLEMAAVLGADWGQGWAIARAMPAAAVPAWVRGWTWSIDPGLPRTELGARAARRRADRDGPPHEGWAG